ncbi:MAG: MBL fold metallo-hydrolase [Candidatus Hermodarchaeota archaeon]
MVDTIQILPIRTGSSGNCSIITDGETTLLLDAGISHKWILKGLELLNLTPGQIDGILISHDHIDHIRGLPVLVKNLNVPIYTGQGTVDSFLSSPTSDNRWDKIANQCIAIEPRDRERIHNFEMIAFDTHHDSMDSLGFTITNDDEVALAFITDTGKATLDMKRFCTNADLLFVESNHDVGMLQSSNRPPLLKKRIRATHLSNYQTLTLIKELQGRKTKGVVLTHLSEECNSHKKLQSTVLKAHTKFPQFHKLRWFVSPRYDFSEHLAISSSQIEKKSKYGLEMPFKPE